MIALTDALKLVITLLFLSLILVMMSCSSINKKIGIKDDNIIEEFLEKQLENQTGIDIDFTPGTPEKK